MAIAFAKEKSKDACKYKFTTLEMELALVRKYGARQNMIIPNISWGFLNHEADLLIMSQSGYLTEIEIKISVGDLKKDFHKRHGHKDDRIKYFYYAIPERMKEHIELIPVNAGVYLVKHTYYLNRVEPIRPAETNKTAKPMEDHERYQLARLGTMRIWTLKRKVDTLLKCTV